MNNKLFARIMTAVICICMMSTVVFAADPTFTAGDETATLSFNVGTDGADITVSSEDQITMMAYLVDATVETPANIPAYTNQAVVAINQVDGADGFGDVLIAASKLEVGKKIAVVIGGSDGTTEKYLVAQEVVEDDVIVTVMNGAAAIEVVADADGNVTLPATAALDVTAPTGYNFTLYSWVTADGATEHLAGAKVAATALEGVTLYAKFVCSAPIGDVNGDGTVDGSDRTAVTYKAYGVMATQQANAGVSILDIVIGDVNGDGVVDGSDRTAVTYKAYGVMATQQANAGKPLYVVNK